MLGAVKTDSERESTAEPTRLGVRRPELSADQSILDARLPRLDRAPSDWSDTRLPRLDREPTLPTDAGKFDVDARLEPALDARLGVRRPELSADQSILDARLEPALDARLANEPIERTETLDAWLYGSITLSTLNVWLEMRDPTLEA